jgi:hypothetical protein
MMMKKMKRMKMKRMKMKSGVGGRKLQKWPGSKGIGIKSKGKEVTVSSMATEWAVLLDVLFHTSMKPVSEGLRALGRRLPIQEVSTIPTADRKATNCDSGGRHSGKEGREKAEVASIAMGC